MSASVLGPVDPASLQKDENEKASSWIVRSLVESIPGRVVMSSYESIKAAEASVDCLSPWGDTTSLQLPCIRFRDLAVQTVVMATGGMAAIAAPVMTPLAEAAVTGLGDTVVVQMGVHAGFELASKAADDLVFKVPIEHLLPIRDDRLQTTATKTMTITLKYSIAMEDAALGYYRASLHQDTSLVSNANKDSYIEKGWFAPYLYASSRKPVIAKAMTPDVIFCHGPFLAGDYRVGETLLAESGWVISFSSAPPAPPAEHHKSLLPIHLPSFMHKREPALATPPSPRRLVILVVGIKPHRMIWSTSQWPGESVIQYVLLNGCPAVVVPVKLGAPLLAWDAQTLETLWKVELPSEGEEPKEKLSGIVEVLHEFLDLCVDWDRVELGGQEMDAKEAVRRALGLLVVSAVRSGESEEVKKEIDKGRSGIAMWRIP